MSTNVGEIDLRLILNSDKFNSQLKTVDAQANNASSKITSTMSKIGKAVAVAFSVTAIVKFGKECLNVATETSNAWIGLNSILTGQGKSFSQAQKFINEYISDGLVPLNNAVTAYKNLAARGYNSEQIEKTMTALKNAATFGRQSTYELGEAVQTASEGLKNENSVLVDNAGVTKNVAKMWEDYAKSIGKTTNELTTQEKIQAEVNGILEETKFQSNDAAIYANTYSGKIAQLNAAFTTMKTAVGNVIQPITKLFVPIITTAVNAVTKLFTALSGLMALFGLKADSVETVSGGMADVATNAENASSAVEGVGSSASNTAKKVKKSLAGFDEMNKLNASNDSGSGSSGGASSGASLNLKDTLNVSSVIQEDTSAFNGLIDRAKELANIFKEGFSISFGDTNFNGILKHFEGIKIAIKDIFSDKDVKNSVNQWINKLSYALGQAVGSIARIGTNIAEGLIGSIDKYFTQNVDKIKKHITNMFNISSKDIELTGNLWQVLGEISDIFKGDTAKQIGADIIAMIANPLMSLNEICMKFVTDIKGILFQPIIDNADKLKSTFQRLLGPIQKVTGTLSEAFTYVGEKWNEVYDTYISPFMESLKTGLSDTFSKFLDVYNQYIVPFLDNMSNGIGTLWNEHLKPVVDKIGAFIGSIISAIQVLWETWLKPLIDWIVANVIPVVVPILEGLWNTVCSVFGAIADTIGGIIDTFKGLIDFVVGIFTGDWNKAWEGIKTFFSGIWDAIKGVVETVWNAIYGVISTVITTIKGAITLAFNGIRDYFSSVFNKIKSVFSSIWNAISTIISNAINNIKTKVTTVFTNVKNTISKIFSSIKTTISNIWNGIWSTIKGVINKILGGIESFANGIVKGINKVLSGLDGVVNAVGKVIGVDIHVKPLNEISLPRLAQGGYVKANTPQLAMIGDNKHQGEIVAPEGKMMDMILTALKMFNEKEQVNDNLQEIQNVVNVILDGETIQRQVDKRKIRLALATNGRR